MYSSEEFKEAQTAIAKLEYSFWNRLTTHGIWQPARHTDLICKKIEAIERGELKRVIFSLPPRHSKSMSITESAPAWFICKKPSRRVMVICYGDALARKFGRRNLNKMKHFAEPLFGIQLADDNSSVSDWGLQEHRGGLLSTGIGGAITGEGADLMLIDDPIKNREEANSLTFRDKVWDEYENTLRTRLTPTGSMIVIACMTGDTPVLMADGTQIPLCEIKVGHQVATYDDGILGTSVVKNHKSNGRDYTFVIKMTNGKMVRANGRHPFLVEEDGELKWIRLKNLNIAQKIVTLRGKETSGKESFAPLKDAKKTRNVGGIATHIITKKNGATDLDPHHTTPNLLGMPTLNTDTELLPQNMTQYCMPKTESVLFVNNHHEVKSQDGIVEGCASITVMKATRSGDFYATNAILPPVILNQKQTPLNWQNTSDFTTEQILSIEPAGIEEVFDIEIERTENFIANGVVSHNTRWHEDDLTGRLLRNEPGVWHEVKLPCEAEENDILGRQIGEPLWPEFGFDSEWIAEFKKTIGIRVWASLFQQRPAPAEGVIFKRDWFNNYYDEVPKDLESIVQSWDMAFKKSSDTSYVVGQVWGVVKARRYLLHQVRRQMGFSETVAAVRDLKAQYPSTRHIFVEDKANGPAVMDMLGREIPGLIPVEPRGSKEARAAATTHYWEARNVFLPRPENAQWVPAFVEEHCSFPSGAADDQVDAASQALDQLGKRGITKPSDIKVGRNRMMQGFNY